MGALDGWISCGRDQPQMFLTTPHLQLLLTSMMESALSCGIQEQSRPRLSPAKYPHTPT